MTTERSRITVVVDRRRLDVAVPSALPLAEVVPELARLSGGVGGDVGVGGEAEALPRSWWLGRLAEPPLSPEASLAQAGVLDGEVLYLRDDPGPLVAGPGSGPVEDVAEAIASAVEARPGRWTAGVGRRLLLVAGGLALVFAGLLLVLSRPMGSGRLAVACGVGVALVVAAASLVRSARATQTGAQAVVLALGSLGFWAAAGVAVADVLAGPGAAGAAGAASAAGGAAPASAAAFGAGGVALGAVAAGLAVPAAAGAATALVTGALVLAAAAAAVALLDIGTVPVAAVVAMSTVVLVAALPTVVFRLVGLDTLREGLDDGGTIRRRVDEGRSLLAWLVVTAAVVAFLALGFLVSGGGTAARLLAVGVVLALALRARRFRFTAEILPLLLAALGGLALLVASLGGDREGAGGVTGGLLGPAVALAVGVALVAWAPSTHRSISPVSSRWLNRLSTVTELALVPLCLAVLGFFTWVGDLASGLVS